MIPSYFLFFVLFVYFVDRMNLVFFVKENKMVNGYEFSLRAKHEWIPFRRSLKRMAVSSSVVYIFA